MQKSVDIRHNDTVQVITGRDKGKKGRVLRVMPDTGKVLVEHVMMVKKNVRPNPQKNIKGGIAEQESAICISNVMLVCTACERPVRVGHEKRGDRRRARLQDLQGDAGEVEVVVSGQWVVNRKNRKADHCQLATKLSSSRTGLNPKP